MGTKRERAKKTLATTNADGSVSLKVCTDRAKKTIKHSKMGKRRAAVLIGLHVLIAIHVGIWLAMGKTVSPVEPSESMETLENGLVNAGFVFFALAILATAIFGRFVCGWGCHIIALQDLCRWMMLKIGIHPKPFRARLLGFVPLGLALYMFVWPNFKRFVVFPAMEAAAMTPPAWLKAVPTPTGFENDFIIDDFWATFPAWFIAIPFLVVVGFASVYFLGAKGFCTYGCPYGGFFAPVDRISPFRIRVTDACEGCGHCTAVCSSNVRVHEEVRDFGMVIDPGCMKCLDCVSVCPNDALYVGLGKPALLAQPTGDAARADWKKVKARQARMLDLTTGEEIIVAIAFLISFFGFRGMLESVPMLMAVGMAGIVAFGVWKSLRIVRDANARLHKVQLKRGGRITAGGFVCVLLTIASLAVAVWSATVQWHRWQGDMLAARVNVPSGLAMQPGFTATAIDVAFAEQALRHYAKADSPAHGGFGWRLTPDELLRVAYLQVVRGDFKAAEQAMHEIVDKGNPTDGLVLQLADLMRASGSDEVEIASMLGGALTKHESMHTLRRQIALRASAAEGMETAEGVWDAAPPSVREDPWFYIERARYWLALGSIGRAQQAMDTAMSMLDTTRHSRIAWVELAEMAASIGDNRVIAFIDAAIATDPHEPGTCLRIAGVLFQTERPIDGRVWLERGIEHRETPIGVLVTAARIYAQLAEVERTRELMDRAIARAEGKPWELAQVGADLVGLGQGLRRTDMIEQGVELVTRAAELKPGSAALTERVAILYANLERFEEAASTMAEAAKLAPRSVLLAQRAAELYAHIDNDAEAEAWRAESARRAGEQP